MPRRHQTRELQVETIQAQPLGCGWVKYRAYLMTLKVGCLYKETITFLELEGSTVDIILGSTNTLQKSDGIPVKSLAGASLVTKTDFPRFPDCHRIQSRSQSVPHSAKVQNLWIHQPYSPRVECIHCLSQRARR